MSEKRKRVRVEHYHLRTTDGELTRTDCTDPACPMSWSSCQCGPGERCFDCATDDELAAAIPPPPGHLTP